MKPENIIPFKYPDNHVATFQTLFLTYYGMAFADDSRIRVKLRHVESDTLMTLEPLVLQTVILDSLLDALLTQPCDVFFDPCGIQADGKPESVLFGWSDIGNKPPDTLK